MAKDLLIKVDEYEKDGETKAKWQKIGVILENQNGEYALLDPSVNFAGVLIKQRLMNPEKAGDSVMVSIFDRSQDRQRNESHPSSDDFDQSNPF